jgi:hypothetical protein
MLLIALALLYDSIDTMFFDRIEGSDPWLGSREHLPFWLARY